ncbi:MAG: hypothetical protein K0Q77_289 [Anaerosporomusa subterranea]|jgi:hypothetical protein|nr:hypothetical protein [Anaerosporomusa subterranea]
MPNKVVPRKSIFRPYRTKDFLFSDVVGMSRFLAISLSRTSEA